MFTEKNKKVVFMDVWFGELPTWIEFFLLSCSKNYDYQWYIFTDQEYNSNYDNVEFVYLTKKDFELLVLKKLKFNCKLSGQYKICDWKPTYAVLFSEYIEGYDFWGLCGLDVIFGDLNNFITDNILNEFDFITKTSHMDLKTGFLPSYTHRVSTPFAIIRNNDYMNNLFKKNDEYHKILVNKYHMFFDEDHFSRIILKLEREKKIKCFWLDFFEAQNKEGTFCDTSWDNGKLYLTEEGTEIGSNHFGGAVNPYVNKSSYQNTESNFIEEVVKFEMNKNSIDIIERSKPFKKLENLVNRSGVPLSLPLGFTDKNTIHPYFDVYDKIFKRLKYSAKNVLEVGIFNGASMILWHDYFENATVHGVEINKNRIPIELNGYDRIKTYLGGAYDYVGFIEPTLNDMEFDLIIDDGSHQLHTQKRFVKHYFPLLSENGILIIEDIQDINYCTEIINEFPEEVRDKVRIIDMRDVEGKSCWPISFTDETKLTSTGMPVGYEHQLRENDVDSILIVYDATNEKVEDLSKKFKEESMIMLVTWAKELEQQKLLLDCITSLDLLGIDICLTSHYPVSTTVQNLVSYYIYDKYNPLISAGAGQGWNYTMSVNNRPAMRIDINKEFTGIGVHSPAVFSSIKHSLHVAKSANKKYVFYTESDTIINPKDLHSFYDVFKETLDNNKKAWFELYERGKEEDVMSCNGEFWFGEVDFFLNNIRFSKESQLAGEITEKDAYDLFNPIQHHLFANRGFGLEHHLYDSLKSVRGEYILKSRKGKIQFQNHFPNSEVNVYHPNLDCSFSGKALANQSKIKIKNFHLAPFFLLSRNKKYGLKPLLCIVNHWMRLNKSQTYNDSMYENAENLFKILYFINDKLVSNREVKLFIKNASIFEQFDEIEEGNIYRVEVELYNKYNRGWDLFYQREWIRNDVDEIAKVGTYELFE